jgi:hypothetical protein
LDDATGVPTGATWLGMRRIHLSSVSGLGRTQSSFY